MARTKVTKEEFDKFLKEYPNHLVRDVFMACEPPLVNYNDWSRGKWPESIVASYTDSESYPKDGDHPYVWEENEYYVDKEAP